MRKSKSSAVSQRQALTDRNCNKETFKRDNSVNSNRKSGHEWKRGENSSSDSSRG